MLHKVIYSLEQRNNSHNNTTNMDTQCKKSTETAMGTLETINYSGTQKNKDVCSKSRACRKDTFKRKEILCKMQRKQ